MRRQTRGYRHKAGERFGEWTLLSPKGRGGNGEVWVATNNATKQQCAVKILLVQSVNSEPYRRLQREVATVVELQGQRMQFPEGTIGILPIFEFHLPTSFSDDSAWFVMPIAERLHEALAGTSALERIAAVSDIGYTLAELARRSVHHRDIKPENLFRHEGRFVVGDFGLAKRPARNETSLTNRKRVPGPFAYLPSEAFLRPREPDWEKIDVYCLAKTLWVILLDEQRPPLGHTQEGGPYSLETRLNEDVYVTKGLDGLIGMATDDDPARRPTLEFFAGSLRLLLHWEAERVERQTQWRPENDTEVYPGRSRIKGSR